MPEENDTRSQQFLAGCIRAVEALTADSLSVSLPRALQLLGESAGIDRVSILEFTHIGDGTSPTASVVAEWRYERRNGGGAANDDAKWDTRWYHEFLEDRVVEGYQPEANAGDTPASRRRSVVAVPIDLDGELWGFLRLDFIRAAILWTGEYESLTRSLTRFLGALLTVQRRSGSRRETTSLSLDQLAREREIAFHLDSRGNWTFLSPAWDRLTGYPATRAIGSNHSTYLFEYRDGSSGALDPVDLIRGLSVPGSRSGEGLLKTEDGSHVWVSYLVIATLAADGVSVRFEGLMVDICEKKAREDRERAAARELQDKNAELLKALMAAQDATRLKGKFLATMSHEIRTPLNGVLGMSSLLLQTSLDRQQREFTDTIQSSAESLLSIVNSILDYSKLEAQRVELEEVLYNPRDLVEEVFASLSEPASRKRIELVTHTRLPMPETVVGDPGKVRQVLLNLVGNAVKFSKKGEVCVKISWEPLLEPSGELRYEVIDQGIGIAPDALRRLFRPFSQAEPATSRIYGGTGLGLAICKQICDLMGGEISVQSKQGVGSRFQLALRANGVSVAPPTAGSSGDLEKLRSKRILLANFGEFSEQAWSWALAERGIRMQRSHSLQEALEELASESPENLTDIVVFDTRSLEGGGPEINRGIRLATQNPHLLLILLDSMHDAVDRSVLKGVEPLLVLRKPISPHRALDMIAAAHNTIIQTPRKPIQRMVRAQRESFDSAVRALIFASLDSRRKCLGYLLRRLGLGTEAADNFQDVLQRSLSENVSFVLLDADLGLSTQLEATLKLRSTLGSSSPPLVGICGSPQSGEQLRQSGLFDAILDDGFQRDDLRRVVDQIVPLGRSTQRVSAS